MDWIRASDKLPKEGDRVLVFSKDDGIIFIGILDITPEKIIEEHFGGRRYKKLYPKQIIPLKMIMYADRSMVEQQCCYSDWKDYEISNVNNLYWMPLPEIPRIKNQGSKCTIDL